MRELSWDGGYRGAHSLYRGAHSLAGIRFPRGPLISPQAPPLLGCSQQLCPRQHGRMLLGPASPAPTVPLISWRWQQQAWQTASPARSAPSADLARPRRGGEPLGRPQPQPLLSSAPHPFSRLRAVPLAGAGDGPTTSA